MRRRKPKHLSIVLKAGVILWLKSLMFLKFNFSKLTYCSIYGIDPVRTGKYGAVFYILRGFCYFFHRNTVEKSGCSAPNAILFLAGEEKGEEVVQWKPAQHGWFPLLFLSHFTVSLYFLTQGLQRGNVTWNISICHHGTSRSSDMKWFEFGQERRVSGCWGEQLWPAIHLWFTPNTKGIRITPCSSLVLRPGTNPLPLSNLHLYTLSTCHFV